MACSTMIAAASSGGGPPWKRFGLRICPRWMSKASA
jgi:hypothetical protein